MEPLQTHLFNDINETHSFTDYNSNMQFNSLEEANYENNANGYIALFAYSFLLRIC